MRHPVVRTAPRLCPTATCSLLGHSRFTFKHAGGEGGQRRGELVPTELHDERRKGRLLSSRESVQAALVACDQQAGLTVKKDWQLIRPGLIYPDFPLDLTGFSRLAHRPLSPQTLVLPQVHLSGPSIPPFGSRKEKGSSSLLPEAAAAVAQPPQQPQQQRRRRSLRWLPAPGPVHCCGRFQKGRRRHQALAEARQATHTKFRCRPSCCHRRTGGSGAALTVMPDAVALGSLRRKVPPLTVCNEPLPNERGQARTSRNAARKPRLIWDDETGPPVPRLLHPRAPIRTIAP